MSQETLKKQEWALDSYLIDDAYTDFFLSRQAKLCSPGTLRFYQFTAGKFVEWLKSIGVNSPDEIASRHVRVYLAELDNRKLSDSYIHGHARAIRTLLRFLHAEKYITNPITFDMPNIAKKRLPVLSVDELKQVLEACKTIRDKAVVLLLADTGVRRLEACTLNWGDIDIASGLVRIYRGKGGKDRSVVIGVTTRRVLLAYRRTVKHDGNDPLLQTIRHTRLTPMGLRSVLQRISKRTQIHFTPHALRRTFATLSLRAGMNLLELQALLGHSSLDMTKRYVDMLEDDLLAAHREHGPIDRFISKKHK